MLDKDVASYCQCIYNDKHCQPKNERGRLRRSKQNPWDIDFNERSIEVCRGFYRNRISKPKNGKTRLVDMSL